MTDMENVKVSDLFIDGDDTQLHIDVGDVTIIFIFNKEGFETFREAINKTPRDSSL